MTLTKRQLLSWLGKIDSDYKARNPLWTDEFNDEAREEIRKMVEERTDYPKPRVKGFHFMCGCVLTLAELGEREEMNLDVSMGCSVHGQHVDYVMLEDGERG